jgi:hypothetical protein
MMMKGVGVVIVHLARRTSAVESEDNFDNLLNTKAGSAADLRAYVRRAAAALAETLIELIIKTILLLPPSFHLSDNGTLVRWYSTRIRKCDWPLSYKTESNFVL